MSDFWSVWVAVIVTLNLALCVFLLLWVNPRVPGEPEPHETMGHAFDGIEEYNNPMPTWWVMMFWGSIVFAIGYLVLYPGYGRWEGLFGWTSHKQWAEEVAEVEARVAPIFAKYAATPVETLASDPEAREVGQRLFLTNCSVCHGSNAQGARGFPNLADSDWLYGGTPDALTETITNGRQAAMPAWAAVLGEDGVNEVAHYVKSLSTPALAQEKPALVAAGQEKFQANCVACHGTDAKGNQLFGAPNLTDEIWLYGGEIATIKETLNYGRQGVMPAHKDLLSKEKIHVLVAYVYGLSHQP